MVPTDVAVKFDLALAIQFLKHHGTGGTREGTNDFPHPAQFHQPRQANAPRAGVIGNTGQILGTLFDQPFNQMIRLAHRAKATDQNG